MSTLSSANVTDVNLVLKERTHMRLCLNMLIFTHNLGNWLMLSTFNVSCQSTVGDMSINRRRHVNQPSATCDMWVVSTTCSPLTHWLHVMSLAWGTSVRMQTVWTQSHSLEIYTQQTVRHGHLMPLSYYSVSPCLTCTYRWHCSLILCFYIVDYAFDTVFIKESCLLVCTQYWHPEPSGQLLSLLVT